MSGEALRRAQIYREMSDEEYFQHRYDYYALNPVAKYKSWREYLEDLPHDDDDEIRETETADKSPYCRTYSPFAPRPADHGGSHNSTLLPYEDKSLHGHSRGLIEDIRYHEENIADSLLDIDIDGLPSQRGAEPSGYRTVVPRQRNIYDGDHREDAYSDRHGGGTDGPRNYEQRNELGARLDRLGDSKSGISSDREQVRQESRSCLENRFSLQVNRNDKSEPPACEERSSTATTARQDSIEPDLPPFSYFDINPCLGSPQHLPRPSSRPDHVEHHPSGGRYNAGVRALRSPVKPQEFIQAHEKQSHPSGGRYNAGVRAPQSQHGSSQQGHPCRNRTLEPNDSMFSRFEEEKSAPRCSRSA
ncbi:MAG: hypothetical protein ALECFALPRED_001844 [Alectoria fallacina]|uniref:Uncharacterized protein n=1 Tax=Alectoria fallacina TaxID=1903189 RepID=A0A8H3II10_9LECA|nr:MAG: hypothetical protein ALECFALPRED_001844 [Alectoria fallacina]